jgi:hypothetical protein
MLTPGCEDESVPTTAWSNRCPDWLTTTLCRSSQTCASITSISRWPSHRRSKGPVAFSRGPKAYSARRGWAVTLRVKSESAGIRNSTAKCVQMPPHRQDIDCLVDRLRKRPIEACEIGEAHGALVTLRQRMSRARRSGDVGMANMWGRDIDQIRDRLKDFDRGVKRGPPEPPEPEPPRKRTCLAGQFCIRGKCPATTCVPLGTTSRSAAGSSRSQGLGPTRRQPEIVRQFLTHLHSMPPQRKQQIVVTLPDLLNGR